jgi:DNA-binding winged helix-turn-helix (wHTH) protein
MSDDVQSFGVLTPEEDGDLELTADAVHSSYPFLDIREPDGNEYSLRFEDILAEQPGRLRITMGRSSSNDIVLPDPHKKVSRSHCAIQREGDRWLLVDEGSANGTFLRQGQGGAELDVRAVDTVLLQDGDVILILGKLTASEQPVFWQLTFRDPNVTEHVEAFQAVAEVEYSLGQQKLFKVMRQQRAEVKLSPQERNLVHYMARRCFENNCQPLVCGYEELIQAIWEEAFGHVPNEVNRLVWSLREKIERDSGEPRFLKTVRGQGYLLDIRIQ